MLMLMQVSPATSGNSNSSSTSDPSTPWFLTEETNCGVDNAYYAQEKESLGDVELSANLHFPLQKNMLCF